MIGDWCVFDGLFDVIVIGMFDYFVWLDGMIVLFVLLSFMGGIVM